MSHATRLSRTVIGRLSVLRKKCCGCCGTCGISQESRSMLDEAMRTSGRSLATVATCRFAAGQQIQGRPISDLHLLARVWPATRPRESLQILFCRSQRTSPQQIVERVRLGVVDLVTSE
jgi:hypothetical protein